MASHRFLASPLALSCPENDDPNPHRASVSRIQRPGRPIDVDMEAAAVLPNDRLRWRYGQWFALLRLRLDHHELRSAGILQRLVESRILLARNLPQRIHHRL